MLLTNTLAILGFGLLISAQSSPTLTVDFSVAVDVSPGVIYLAPNNVPGAGPQVFNLSGSTIFNGAGMLGSGAIHDFQPCTYKRSLRYCAWKGTVSNGYGNGDAMVLNKDLSVEKAVPNVDYHEFDIKQSLNTANGQVTDIALLTTYTPVQRDLSAFGVTNENQGWVIDCHLRAVDLASDKVIFEWSALDHVNLDESYVLPTGAINGLTQQFAWDYFHLSSIARLGSGDYIVSSRHTSTIYRVSAKDGSIVWRLGGKRSSFIMNNLKFSSQHDVRVISEKGNVLRLSLFDNAYNKFTPPQDDSSGKIIELDIGTKTARLVQEYGAPQAGFQAGDGGSIQVLPSGNVFIGWGSIPYVTEYSPGGQLIYKAHFGGLGSSASSYRAFKAPYTPINTGPKA